MDERIGFVFVVPLCFIYKVVYLFKCWQEMNLSGITEARSNENARKVVLPRIFKFPRIFIVVDFEVIVEKVRGFDDVKSCGYF